VFAQNNGSFCMPKAKAAGGYSRSPETRYSPRSEGILMKNVTHLGEAYAALLVDPATPRHKVRKCCGRRQPVAAVAVVKGQTAILLLR